MKKLEAKYLEVLLFLDRDRERPLLINNREVRVREYLKTLMDQPFPPSMPLTRELSKSLDRVYEALSLPDAIFEEKDFDNLKKLVQELRITVKPVYDTVMDTLEAAVDYKPS